SAVSLADSGGFEKSQRWFFFFLDGGLRRLIGSSPSFPTLPHRLSSLREHSPEATRETSLLATPPRIPVAGGCMPFFSWCRRSSPHLRIPPRPTVRKARLLLESLEDRLTPATITVTSTGNALLVNSAVSLREAITSINNGANVNTDVVAVGAYGTNDTILFNV